MERNVEQLLQRASLLITIISTLTLLYLSSLSSNSSCPNHHYFFYHHHHHYNHHLSFPNSSCDAASRRHLPPPHRLQKLRSSPSWRRRVLSISSILSALPLPPRPRALCVSAAPGHAVDALNLNGARDVTAVDVIDFPPLVSRADPHNLPFFDDVFDVGFSSGLEGALFPARFASEMERTVRRGGVCVVAVGRGVNVEGVKRLFTKSRAVGVWNGTLDGADVTAVAMRKRGVKRRPT